jgi:C4-type Zn-finger protein
MELNIKRLYLPFTFTKTCPVCGSEVTLDLNERNLYYPKANTPIEVEVWCLTCDERDDETYVDFRIQLNLEVVSLDTPEGGDD